MYKNVRCKKCSTVISFSCYGLIKQTNKKMSHLLVAEVWTRHHGHDTTTTVLPSENTRTVGFPTLCSKAERFIVGQIIIFTFAESQTWDFFLFFFFFPANNGFLGMFPQSPAMVPVILWTPTSIWALNLALASWLLLYLVLTLALRIHLVWMLCKKKTKKKTLKSTL